MIAPPLAGQVDRPVFVAATRALFDIIDADALDRVRSGEALVVATYEAAHGVGLPAPVQARVAGLLDDLRRLLAATGPKGRGRPRAKELPRLSVARRGTGATRGAFSTRNGATRPPQSGD
jgi:hypothetical protein